MSAVLCFGELLLRLSPSQNKEMASKHPMVLFVGGAEANVATALSGWGESVKYCTALPDHFLSHSIIQYLQRKQIDTNPVVFCGSRVGLYYLETGADIKGGVVYDRERSSFSELKTGQLDWDTILDGCNWFHATAITPALNASLAAVLEEGMSIASAKGLTVSIDLNYRSKLWKYGKQPHEVMPSLVQYCDVIMGNIWSANSLLGIPVDPQIHDHKSKQAYVDHANHTAALIRERFPKCTTVANTFRFDSPGDTILYYTTLQHNGIDYVSDEFICAGVVDRSGSGDCFMAGLIYGIRNKPTALQELLNYATAAAFGKLQEQGDATDQDTLSVEEGYK